MACTVGLLPPPLPQGIGMGAIIEVRFINAETIIVLGL